MLKRAWAAWKQLAHKIGNFQARVLLTVLYAVLILPFGVVVRCFSDPLRLKRSPQGWLDHGEAASTMDWARRQW